MKDTSIQKIIFKKRVKAVIFSLLAFFIVLYIFYYLTMSISGWFGFLVFPASFIVFHLVGNYFVRAKHFVVWFRRFHRKEETRFRFSAILHNSCRDLCIPITIQDSQFKRSYIGVGSRWNWGMLIFGGYVLLLWMAFSIIIILIFLSTGLMPDKGASDLFIKLAMVIGVVPLLALGYGVRERLGLRGFYELEADSALDKAGKILTGLVKRLFRFQGVLIFKCPDVVWHDVVAFILRRAQAVLIDVSQPSENLVWELETSLKTKPAEAIIIAYDHPAAAEGLEHLPDEVRLALERIQRESDLSQLRYFAYPATKPPFGLGRLKVYGSLSRKLKEELGRCLGL